MFDVWRDSYLRRGNFLLCGPPLTSVLERGATIDPMFLQTGDYGINLMKLKILRSYNFRDLSFLNCVKTLHFHVFTVEIGYILTKLLMFTFNSIHDTKEY